MNKLVTIVLPTYNGSRFLRDSIESVLNQTYQEWELIIVNDCSTDNTLEIAKEYEAKDARIKVVTNQTNKKLPASLNVGFSLAKGDYYTWTSDDNMYKPDAIEFMVNYLNNNIDVDLISCSFDYIDENGKFLKVFLDNRDRYQVDLAHYCNIGACFMYRKEIANKVGGYNEEAFCAEDYEYWCRIALEGNIKYSDENLYIYRKNPASLTATKSHITKKLSLNIRKKYAKKIMNKCKLSNWEKTKKFIQYYLHQKNCYWLFQAIFTNPFGALYFIIKSVLQDIYAPLYLFYILYFSKYKNKKIVFWGASLFLEKFLKVFSINKNNILGIVDKNDNLIGKQVGKYEIYATENLSQLEPDNIILTIANNNKKIYQEITKYLNEKYPNIKLIKNIFLK